MDNNTSPVDLAINRFGGVRALARAIGRDPAAISRWKKTGNIPTSIQRRILEVAWERGISMTAHDMIFGND